MTYEDLQREISKDLESYAEIAKKWQCLVAGDESGYAEGIAAKSYKAFSKFLIEEHIACGGSHLQMSPSTSSAEKIREDILEISKMLHDYVGHAERTFSKRREVMKFLNDKSHLYSSTGFYGDQVKALNRLAGLKREPTGDEKQIAYAKSLDGPDFKYTDKILTAEIVEELLRRTNNIKTSSLTYIRENAASASRYAEAISSSGSPGSPNMVPETAPSSPAAETPPSAQPASEPRHKRGFQSVGGKGQGDPSSKRLKMIESRSASSSADRDM